MKYITLFLILFLISGCASIKKDKIDYIAEQEEKITYVLPNLNECSKLHKLEDKSFKSLYIYTVDLINLYNLCNSYNEEKNSWIKRNIK